MSSQIVPTFTVANACDPHTRTIVARHMNTCAANRALKVLRMRRMLMEAQIRLLFGIETLWAKQGLLVCGAAERLFPVGDGIECERNPLKQITRFRKLLKLHQFFSKGSVFLSKRAILLRRFECKLLKREILISKVQELLPQGFNGSVDEFLAIRLDRGGNVLDALSGVANRFDHAYAFLYSGEVSQKIHSSPRSSIAVAMTGAGVRCCAFRHRNLRMSPSDQQTGGVA